MTFYYTNITEITMLKGENSYKIRVENKEDPDSIKVYSSTALP